MKYANRNREDELLGKTIAFLRFPLSVAVVLLHSSVIDSLVGGGGIMVICSFLVFSILLLRLPFLLSSFFLAFYFSIK